MASNPKPATPPTPSGTDPAPTNRHAYWQEQIAKANKRWEQFWLDGDRVLDRFMLESKQVGDKYNILYSSTETIKPSLYGQTPKVEVKNKQQDTTDSIKVAAAMILEQVGQYAIDSLDFDYILQNVVSDYVLPGIGVAWIRYDPRFAPMYGNDNTPALNEDGSNKEYLTYEGLALDYVHYKDFLTGTGREWHELPWVARRVYFTKEQATKRFGSTKAVQLAYSYNAQDRADRERQNGSNPKRQAVIYEIWDRDRREVVWFSEDYPGDVLDARRDPLRLENFFPCPRPLRAVWTTRSFIPKALYSQYKAQAAELDRLTERIRYLTEALKVRGLYDGSQENLANVLEGPGNKMIPVQDWAAFMGQSGIAGSVQWVPIKEVVNCLTELFKQREICKNEIYEITGFSDIVRGVSKASETLGAQQIKADWATGRLKDMQREVQRFIRDLIRIMTEIASEHFSTKTLMVYSGIEIPPPTPQEQQAAMQAMQAGQPAPPTQGQIIQQMFDKAVALIRDQKLRCASVGIETDSTILPDEQKERADRMAFLSSMGAFLQQAGPMALQFPDMRGLLGGIMMFTLRTFSASRPLEKEFEAFQQKLQAMPPSPPPGQGEGDGGQAAAQAQQATAQIKAQSDQQVAQMNDATKRYEVDQKILLEKQKLQQDHEYRMAQLRVEEQKLALEKTKIALETIATERDTEAGELDKQYERSEAERERQLGAQEAAESREDARTDAEKADERENRKIDVAEKAATAKAVDSRKKKAD